MGARGRQPNTVDIDLRKFRLDEGLTIKEVAFAWPGGPVSLAYIYFSENMRRVPVERAERYHIAIESALAVRRASAA